MRVWGSATAVVAHLLAAQWNWNRNVTALRSTGSSDQRLAGRSEWLRPLLELDWNPATGRK